MEVQMAKVTKWQEVMSKYGYMEVLLLKMVCLRLAGNKEEQLAWTENALYVNALLCTL